MTLADPKCHLPSSDLSRAELSVLNENHYKEILHFTIAAENFVHFLANFHCQ